MTTEHQSLSPWDYVVIAIVLLISASIGIYYRFTGGKQKTIKEYLLADKNMSIVPVAFSLMASFMSSITLLGVSSENYTFGIQFIVINLSYGLFTPIAAYIYLPVFFKLQATSAYEYLEKRFGKLARLAASLAFTLQMTLYMGIALYAPALALEALTGISKVAAILLVGAVCTFYSTIGGMKAVLVTDVFQSLLMFAAVFCIIIHAIIDKGFVEIFRIADRGKRTDLLNFDPNPTVRHSWFSLIIGGGVTFLTLYGVSQTQVQRYLSVKDLKRAQNALWLNWPILSALSLSTSFAGLSIYSKYYNCDPVAGGRISSTDQLMPLYVMETMHDYPGLSGLFVAGIFSASLSTVSAALNSLSAATIEDYYKPLYEHITKNSLSEKKISIQSKFIALFFGCVCIGVAFLAQFLGGVLQAALTIFGVVGGPLLATFSLGMFTTTANEKGALAGLICGISLCLWTAFGNPRPPLPSLPVSVEGCSNGYFSNASVLGDTKSATNEGDYFWLYKLSYLYNGVLGLLVSFMVGYVISFLLNKIKGYTTDNLDPNLFISPIARRLRKMRDETDNVRKLSNGGEDVLKSHVTSERY